MPLTAWINGKQVQQALPMPGWKQFPWQTYTVTDVTSALQSGRNLLAVEVLLYAANPSGLAAAGGGRRRHLPASPSRWPTAQMSDLKTAMAGRRR